MLHKQSILMYLFPTAAWSGMCHYSGVIMGTIASQITSLTIVYSTADERKNQSSASLAFVQGIHRGTGEFPAQMANNAENVSIWWRHHGGNCYAGYMMLIIFELGQHAEPIRLSIWISNSSSCLCIHLAAVAKHGIINWKQNWTWSNFLHYATTKC